MARKSDFEEGSLFSFDTEEPKKKKSSRPATEKTGRKERTDSSISSKAKRKTDPEEKKETGRVRRKRGKPASEEEPALFTASPMMENEEKPLAQAKPEPKAKRKAGTGKISKKTVPPEPARKPATEQLEIPGKGNPSTRSAGEEAAAKAWKEKFWEFDLTKPSQFMKDTMKESMLAEGFGKREANKVFKGLFFKEKVCNTKAQAIEYLLTIPNSYAVKYKIGIPPSPQMEKLEKRLHEKEEKLKKCREEQAGKFKADFLTCPHCKSRINGKFIHPPLCPVCGEDLRSETAIRALHSLEEAVKDLSKRYEDTARRYNAKFTGGEKWVVHLVNPLYDGENDSKGK